MPHKLAWLGTATATVAVSLACACFALSVEFSLYSVLFCFVSCLLLLQFLYLFAVSLIRKYKKKYIQMYVYKYIGDAEADMCLVCLSTLVKNTDRTCKERMVRGYKRWKHIYYHKQIMRPSRNFEHPCLLFTPKTCWLMFKTFNPVYIRTYVLQSVLLFFLFTVAFVLVSVSVYVLYLSTSATSM